MSCGGEAPREGLVAPLVDLNKSPAERFPVKKTAERAAKFIFRVNVFANAYTVFFQ